LDKSLTLSYTRPMWLYSISNTPHTHTTTDTTVNYGTFRTLHGVYIIRNCVMSDV